MFVCVRVFARVPGAKLPKPILAIISPSSMGSSLGGRGPRLGPFTVFTTLGGGGPRLGPFTVFEEDFAGIKASSPRSGGPSARGRAAGAPATCCPRIARSSAWSSSLSLPRRGIETANVYFRNIIGKWEYIGKQTMKSGNIDIRKVQIILRSTQLLIIVSVEQICTWGKKVRAGTFPRTFPALRV